MRKVAEKISWAFSDSIDLDPTQSIEHLKNIGPIWGSWRTWRSCQTDNVLCHDQVKAADLVRRNFQNSCNFYLPESVHAVLDRPQGIRTYAGEFVHDVVRQEEIVMLHLAASTSDIVLLMGWNFGELEPDNDLVKANQARHHRNLVRQAFKTYNQTQWVIVDHTHAIDPNLIACPNVVTDSLDNILTLTQH